MRSELIPTVVGGFVLTGIILVIAFLLYRFEEAQLEGRETFVMYFQGTMNGLEVGSEVTFRGIKVGEVVNIGLELDQTTQNLEIPVYVQFLQLSKDRDQPRIRSYLLKSFKRGLRAELYGSNLVTGAVAIRLVFKDDAVPYIPPVRSKFRVIPTTTSPRGEINLAKALDTAEKTFAAIRQLAESVSPKLNTLLTDATGAANDTRGFVKGLSTQVGPSVTQLNHTLHDISLAADAFRQLASHLERHPESLLTGKQ